jgi:pilus assembly protein Flp/PilA
MFKFLDSYMTSESGAAAAEYALILAIVGAGIAAAAIALGSSISKAISGAASLITSATSAL